MKLSDKIMMENMVRQGVLAGTRLSTPGAFGPKADVRIGILPSLSQTKKFSDGLPKPMEQVTVTFERVFDVVHPSAGGVGPCTNFGFQFGELKKYSIAAPGNPRIEPGMTVTAVLGKSGDWQSLFGWVDHANGDVVCKGIGRYIGSIFLPVFACGFAFVVRAYPLFAALVLTIGTCGFIGGAVSIRDIFRARKILHEVAKRF